MVATAVAISANVKGAEGGGATAEGSLFRHLGDVSFSSSRLDRDYLL